MSILALILAIFFAITMGGSNICPAFAVSYGTGVIGRKRAALLFGFFVLLGAYIAGGNVVKTISGGIVPQHFIDIKVTCIILLSASLSLFIANILKVPVSTSSVTVFSLIGVGLYFKELYIQTLLRIFSFWLILPFLAYLFTYLLGRFILPLENSTLIKRQERSMKFFLIGTGCYMAFALGSNNVANAAGPLVASKILSLKASFLLIAPFFGLGGLLFKGNLDTVGKEITTLGVLGGTLIGIVIGSMLLLASIFGIPEPMVMMDALSIMGIGSVNHGHRILIEHLVIRKIFTLWIVSPLLSLSVSYLLVRLILDKFYCFF